MVTILLILAIAALITSILTLMGKCPVGVPLLLLSVFACLQVLPLK